MISPDDIDDQEAVNTMGQRVARIAALSFGGLVVLGLLSAYLTGRFVPEANVSLAGVAACGRSSGHPVRTRMVAARAALEKRS